MNVSTTATRITGAATAILEVQNLGPDDLYVGDDNTVSSTTGLKLGVGGLYTCPRSVGAGVALWVVSSGVSDTRVKAG